MSCLPLHCLPLHFAAWASFRSCSLFLVFIGVLGETWFSSKSLLGCQVFYLGAVVVAACFLAILVPFFLFSLYVQVVVFCFVSCRGWMNEWINNSLFCSIRNNIFLLFLLHTLAPGWSGLENIYMYNIWVRGGAELYNRQSPRKIRLLSSLFFLCTIITIYVILRSSFFFLLFGPRSLVLSWDIKTDPGIHVSVTTHFRAFMFSSSCSLLFLLSSVFSL